ATAGLNAPYGGRPRSGVLLNDRPSASRACAHWAVAWLRDSLVRLGWETVWSAIVPPASAKARQYTGFRRAACSTRKAVTGMWVRSMVTRTCELGVQPSSTVM